MGLLDRWDRHNQEAMDRDRTRDITEWTVFAAVFIALALLRIAADLPTAVAVVLQLAIVAVAAVGIVRIVRRRRAEGEPDEAAAGTSS